MRMTATFGRSAGAFVVATLLSVAPVRAVDTVTIGTVGSPSANLWPLFIGIEKGFFTAENIKLDRSLYPIKRRGHSAALRPVRSTCRCRPASSIRSAPSIRARHCAFTRF